MTILANDPNAPFMMYVGQLKYTDRTARILGKLKGAADAQFLLGFRSRLLTPSESAQPSATNTTQAIGHLGIRRHHKRGI